MWKNKNTYDLNLHMKTDTKIWSLLLEFLQNLLIIVVVKWCYKVSYNFLE